MSIYVKYGAIPGDATADHHKGSDGWWQAGSCQFGLGRGISTPTGSAVDRNASQASMSEVTVTKVQNSQSTDFFQAATNGEGVECYIDFVQDGGNAGQTYQKFKLFDAMISGYSTSSGGDGRPSESISINFAKIEFGTYEHDTTGTQTNSFTKTYDIGMAKFV